MLLQVPGDTQMSRRAPGSAAVTSPPPPYLLGQSPSADSDWDDRVGHGDGGSRKRRVGWDFILPELLSRLRLIGIKSVRESRGEEASTSCLVDSIDPGLTATICSISKSESQSLLENASGGLDRSDKISAVLQKHFGFSSVKGFQKEASDAWFDYNDCLVLAGTGSVNESLHDDSSVTLPPIVRIKKIHVSSVILAGSSEYFKKLFTNGMLESKQKEVTLKITEAEEMPLQDLLSFMYGEEILTTDHAHIIDILMVADKYQVISCVTHCSELLTTCTLSTEVALLYLNLDCSIPTALEPARDAAKKFLCNKYQDFLRFENEIMGIGPSGLEAILSSSDLKVPSEDYLFDFIVNWGCIQYPDRGERLTVVSSLLPLIRYSHLSCGKLSKIMKCQDIDLNVAWLPLVRALLFKSDPASRQQLIDGPEPWRYEQWAYLYRPLEVMQLHRPVKQCMVYMDLNTDDCSKMFPTGSILSEEFHFAKNDFFLTAGCIVQQPGPLHSFGLFLGVTGDCPLPVTVKYEFSARAKPSGDFIVKWSYTHTFTQADVRMGRRNLFSVPWAAFVDYDNNPWFIGGVMYLRAILTLVIE